MAVEEMLRGAPGEPKKSRSRANRTRRDSGNDVNDPLPGISLLPSEIAILIQLKMFALVVFHAIKKEDLESG